jgi:hypothetical protein
VHKSSNILLVSYPFQANGDNIYSNGIVISCAEQTDINLINNKAVNDGKFVNRWLTIVFGHAVLGTSSITGATKRDSTCYKLDEQKLDFVRGKTILQREVSNFLLNFNPFLLSFTEQYATRLQMVDDENERYIRYKRFNEHVSRKIINVRNQKPHRKK